MCDKNNSALYKVQFQQKILHDFVIGVSINAKMPALRVRPINTKFSCAACNSVGGDSVNNSVRFIANPVAVGNNFVSWLNIFFEIVKKSYGDFPVFNANITFPGGNIRMNQIFRRSIIKPPLIRVAVLLHKFSCKFVNLHNNFKIVFSRFSYFHSYTSQNLDNQLYNNFKNKLE